MAIGSALKASVGIGLALFVVPVLALIDQSFIPGPMLLAGVALALSTAYRERTSIDAPAPRNSLTGLAIGTIVGACTLKFASAANLDRTFGVRVLLAVLLSVSGYKFDATRRSLIFAGGAAGVMGAMVGIHEPPISLVFQNSSPVSPEPYPAPSSRWRISARCALAAFGFVWDFLSWSVRQILLPGVATGLAVAPPLARHIDGKRLRLIILGIAAIGGVIRHRGDTNLSTRRPPHML